VRAGARGALSAGDPEPLLEDSVRLILSWQNDDGGWATYERQRAGAWMEQLNPSESLRRHHGRLLVRGVYERVYSGAGRREDEPGLRLSLPELEVDKAIVRGVRFLRAAQLPDGSFEGSWAVCFSYGTWFGVSGLLAAGVSRSDPAIERACDYLLRRQRARRQLGRGRRLLP
jgi:squalene cyclase